jgi:hypothetical protein
MRNSLKTRFKGFPCRIIRRPAQHLGENRFGNDQPAVTPVVSVITIIDGVMFTLFDGFAGDAERECSDRTSCRSWC